MNIVFFISSLGSGGAERALSALANHYADTGNAVFLVTLVSSNTAPFYPIHPKIKVIQTNKSSKGKASVLTRIFNICNSLLEIRRIIRQLKADKVVSFIDLMNVRVLLASMGLTTPVIISERTDPAHHRLPMKKLSEWLRLKLYPRAYRIIVQTQSAANYFPSNFHNKITVISNVVREPDKIKQPLFNQIKNIITVGRLSEEKNHKALIVSFSEWVKNIPNLKLKIYGEGPNRLMLEKLISELNLNGKVTLPGAVKGIQEALLEADLFVFPSKYEGFPNALCEAMAIGLPVVASDCSGNAEVIQHRVNGLLYPVGDMQALTKSVLELIADSHLCQALSHQASKIVDRYGPEKIYKLWDNVILSK